MAKRRRIVPDASVMLPAFFREQIDHGGGPFDLTRVAKPIVDAIYLHKVEAFAPEVLLSEFMNAAYSKCSPRHGQAALKPDEVEQQFFRFLSLPIVIVPCKQLAENAWRLTRNQGVPPPDSWYAACAVSHDAEFWISHAHEDRLRERVQQAGVQVYMLTNRRFDDVTA